MTAAKKRGMKEPLVYLLCASHGCYEDYQEVVLLAYFEQAEAEAERERLTKLDTELWSQAHKWREKHPEPHWQGKQEGAYQDWEKWDARHERLQKRLSRQRRCQLGNLASDWDAPDYSVCGVPLMLRSQKIGGEA